MMIKNISSSLRFMLRSRCISSIPAATATFTSEEGTSKPTSEFKPSKNAQKRSSGKPYEQNQNSNSNNNNSNNNNYRKNYQNKAAESKKAIETAVANESVANYVKRINELPAGSRLSESTNRLELNLQREKAIAENHIGFNLMLAKCYVNHSRYFQEFFSEEDLAKLLRTDYTVEEFASFFENFLLANVLLTDLSQFEEQIRLNKLFTQFSAKLKETTNSEAAAVAQNNLDQMKIYQMGCALKFIPRVGEIELNSDLKTFLDTFVHTYYEKLLDSVSFTSKEVFSSADLFLIAQFFLLKARKNSAEALEFIQKQFQAVLSTSSTFTPETSKTILQVFTIVLGQQERLVLANLSVFLPLLSLALNKIENKRTCLKEIVEVFYAVARTETTNKQEASECILLLKSLESVLDPELRSHLNLHQKKSILYSVGKSSYRSPAVKQFLEESLEGSNLDSIEKQKSHSSSSAAGKSTRQVTERADQFLSNLLLSTSNLGVLTKAKVTDHLISTVFAVASKSTLSEIQRIRFLVSAAICFYRMHYFESTFWTRFFESLGSELPSDSFFLTQILRTYQVYKPEMSEDVFALFEVKANEFAQLTLANNFKDDMQIGSIFEDQLTEFLKANSHQISFQSSVQIDEGFFVNAILAEKTAILILRTTNYIVSDPITQLAGTTGENGSQSSSALELNISTSFRIDYLQRKGFKVVVLNSFADDFAAEMTQKITFV